MESPIQITEENKDASQSKEDGSIEERVRGKKGQGRVLRSGTEDKEEEKEKVTKRILIVPTGDSPLFKVKYEGGGELPACLQGSFTSTREADIAIARYLDQKRN